METRRSDTLRDDARNLPPVPQSQQTKRKSRSADTTASTVSSVDNKERKVKQKNGKQSGGSSDGGRKKMGGLDPGKYAHLPVYDKEEERRKAREREKKMSEIFSEVNNQLEDITGLTSSHMENRGVTLVQSQQHYSDDVHTIRYNHGVLLPRKSECQTQVMKENSIVELNEGNSSSLKEEKTKILNKENDVQTIHSAELTKSKKDKGAMQTSPFCHEDAQSTDHKPFGEEDGEEGESIEETDQMELRKGDLNDRDIPFIDSDDPATKLDMELETVLEENLDLGLRVERIQLETSDRGSSSASLVVNHRECKGTDTVHMSTKTVVKEYRDI